jgi:hypothetical protein
MALAGLITVSPSSSELVATMQRVKPSIAGQEQARPGCALCADASNESNALTHTEASLENSNNQTKASLPPLPAARAGLSQPPMHPHPWPSVGSASRSCLLAKLTTHKQHTAHTQGSCAGTQTAEKLAYLPAPRTLAAAVRSRDDVQQACTSRTCNTQSPAPILTVLGLRPSTVSAPSRQWHTAMRKAVTRSQLQGENIQITAARHINVQETSGNAHLSQAIHRHDCRTRHRSSSAPVADTLTTHKQHTAHTQASCGRSQLQGENIQITAARHINVQETSGNAHLSQAIHRHDCRTRHRSSSAPVADTLSG